MKGMSPWRGPHDTQPLDEGQPSWARDTQPLGGQQTPPPMIVINRQAPTTAIVLIIALALTVLLLVGTVGYLVGEQRQPVGAPRGNAQVSSTETSVPTLTAPPSATSVVAQVATPGATTTLAGHVTLPVVLCPTEYGMMGASPPADVSPITARTLPPALASQLAVYVVGDSTFLQAMLAPRGWVCAGIVGANGSYGLTVSPQAQPSTGSLTGQAVTLAEEGACQTCIQDMVCPYFDLSSVGGCTSTIPSGEIVQRLSGSAVAFEDRPGARGAGDPSGGAYPANGVILFGGVASGRLGGALIATCTLPESEHALCTAILNDILTTDSRIG